VVPGGILESQRAIEQNLSRGGLEQIGAAHHFRMRMVASSTTQASW